MRAFVVALCCVGLTACNLGIRTCTEDSECEPGAVCQESFCVLPSDGGTGGGGGGVTGGGGGGAIGGGGGGGVQVGAFCADAGLRCAGWQECAPNRDGGTCEDARYLLTWVVPDAGSRHQASASVQLIVTKEDAGTLRPATVPVRGLESGQTVQLTSGSMFTGVLTLTGTDGAKNFVAGWEDGGPTNPRSVVKDTTAPLFGVAVVGAPDYGADDGGFLALDPAEPRAGLPLIKKDETVTLEVTSTASDVDPLSVRMRLRAGGAEWDAGVGAACGAAAFCREYSVALGSQPMNAFLQVVNADVTGADDLGNASSVLDAGVMRVTRWKWAKLVTGAYELKAAPALSRDGDLFLGARGSAAGAVYRVTPSGTASIESSAGPVEAGLAIGRYSSGSEVVFFMTTNGEIQALDGGSSCGGPSAGNVGSLAIINDGAPLSGVPSPLMGVGVVGTGTGRQLRGLQAGNGCAAFSSEASGVAPMAYPGNIVIKDDEVWYATSTGLVNRFRLNGTFISNGSVTGLGAGSLYGISLFDNGSMLAGGGGAGIGRLFVLPSDGGMPPSGYDMSAHVSGVAVGAGNALFAVTQSADTFEVGTLRRFDATGAAVAAVPPSATFSFPAGSIPGATTPVLGNGGWVYATGNDGTVVAAGQGLLDVRWVKVIPPVVGGGVVASPTLDCNRTKPGSGTGIHYFATTTGWVVAYITESPGLDVAAPWPKYQHDGRNTGRVGTSVACP